MAVILTVTSNPENFAIGAWPATALNSGIWRFTITPASASGPAYSNYAGLFAQSTGGIWIVNSALELYTSPADLIACSRPMTWSAGQPITITVDVPSATVTISGATTGNGSFPLVNPGPYFASGDGLRAGGAFGVSGFAFAGSISSIDDTNTSTVFSRSSQATAAAALAVDVGVRVRRRAGALAAAAAFVTSFGAATLHRGSSVAAATTFAVDRGHRTVHRGAHATAQAGFTLDASGAFGLGAFGSARRLFGTPAGTVSTTLDTAASGSTILIAVGGNLGDLVTLPTDSRGNTWTTVGTEEYARWAGYGVKLYRCIGASGGAGHVFSQQYGQTAGFDECTIAVVEIRGATWVNASSLVERPIGVTVATGAVASATACEWIVFLSGDAPTGATAALAPSNGLAVIDDSTGIDHPNGYVPIVIMRAAKGAGSHSSVVGISPSQGAVIGAFAVQALRVEARESAMSGGGSLEVGRGIITRRRGAASTAGVAMLVDSDVITRIRGAQVGAATSWTSESGIVLPPGGLLVERSASMSAVLAVEVTRSSRLVSRDSSSSATAVFAVERGVRAISRGSAVSGALMFLIGHLLREALPHYNTKGVSMPTTLVAGDLEPDLILQLLEDSGLGNGGVRSMSLVGASSLELRVRRPDGSTVTRAATIEDAERGMVRYIWTPDDTAQVGQHRGLVVITWENGERQTVPSDGSAFLWIVHPAL